MPPNPCTTKARREPSCASASAKVRTSAGEKTPKMPARTPAGFVSGPRTLKIVRVPSSRRTGAACLIAGWCAGANMKPKPSVVDRLADALGRLLELEAERLEHVRRSRDRAHRPVAVLGDRTTGGGGDDRGRGRDVERPAAVAPGADDVDDVLP